MDTAVERETNRAGAPARQRYGRAESEARANAALPEAQALDIRAVTAARAPEILEHRYQQQVLDTLEQVADHLLRPVRIGGADGARTGPQAPGGGCRAGREGSAAGGGPHRRRHRHLGAVHAVRRAAPAAAGGG
ncbi:hypothetical protein [Streptomyces sp. 13-12-16]|uniref:hypothetical protein n=1 Tax=Streptomyces sp. 13-12-16 TaxID=1570823 RepID=UPI00358EBF4D